MSIRLKILLGCLCLTTLTIFVGLFAQSSQREIGDLATRLYDNSLLSTNALRSAQGTITKARTEIEIADGNVVSQPLPTAVAERVGAELSAAEADLFLASSGSISETGRTLVDQTRRRLTKVSLSDGAVTPRLLLKELRRAEDEIDAAVRVFSADAYDVKGDVGLIMQTSITKTRFAIGIAAALMLLVAWGLSRTIVPSLRRAVAVAKSIAGGDFSNRIEPTGRGEGAELLEALATMQDRIAQRFDRFETTVATHADALHAERSVHSGRLDTALETMMHGLCMFDAGSKVSVVNRRFIEIFGHAEIKVGARLSYLAKLPELGAVLSSLRDAASVTHETAAGRILSVTKRKAADGGQVLSVTDVTDDRMLAAKIDHAANHDGMTGLSNRFALTKRLQAILDNPEQAMRTSLLVLDIDGFRGVNEAHGHEVGDALLKLVSERLLELAHEDDVVARIGGDDFALVRTGFSRLDDMKDLAESIVDAFDQPFDVGGRNIRVGVSIGIAPARDSTEKSSAADVLFLKAEFALATARAAGRNNFRYFEPAMEAAAHLRRQTEADLAKALANGEFEVFYQPLIDVPMRAVSGFEALLRWRHPERGMISPGEFIPIAEEAGLIAPIGLWVLENACRHAANWPRGLTVAVNLSPFQFRSDNLFGDIDAILKRTGFEPYRLQLEVTEGAFLQNSEPVMATLAALRKLGIRISMDDFGTGYSSLGYLSRFPFDKVKIDQSFVRDLAKRENLMIVRAIIGLSKAMGLSVTAEGVETRRQMETLLAENCSEMQGYYFAMPMPHSDLPRFMMQFSLDRSEGWNAEAGWLQSGTTAS